MIKSKIKSKQGGVMIIIVLAIIMITFIGLIPTIVDSSSTHIASKKIKSHLNAISNSVALVVPSVGEDGYLSFNHAGGSDVVKKMMEVIFKETFTLTTTPLSSSDYYSATYKNADNTVAIQYIFYNKGTNIKEPNVSLISPFIQKNSLNESLDTVSMTNFVKIEKPSVVIIMRYDTKSMYSKSRKSMIRVASTQINTN